MNQIEITWISGNWDLFMLGSSSLIKLRKVNEKNGKIEYYLSINKELFPVSQILTFDRLVDDDIDNTFLEALEKQIGEIHNADPNYLDRTAKKESINKAQTKINALQGLDDVIYQDHLRETLEMIWEDAISFLQGNSE